MGYRAQRQSPASVLVLIALFTCKPVEAADVVGGAASPLAQPKSMRQVGPPPAASKAAIPADKPQTAEKIALGQRLFFEGRLSADGPRAGTNCRDPAPA